MHIKHIFNTLLISSAALFALPALATPPADGGYYVSDQPLTLDIHFHTQTYVYNNQWPVEKEAARLTNVHLNNVASMATLESQQAFILMLATGELPAIVGGSGIKNNVNHYGPEGAFIPLNDLIDKYAPHIKDFFANNPDIRSSLLAADGNIYYIPYLPGGDLGRGYFIRYDWLEKLNLKVPQNIDELYKVLVAFRENDPNGNGKKDEIPLFMRNWQELIRLVTLWGGRSTGSANYHDFYLNDGLLQHGYLGEGYHQGIRHLAKWYQQGLIDPEIFTRGKRTREFLLLNDLGGMTHDWFASTAGYNDSVQVPGFSFKAMAPPVGSTGKRIEEHRRAKVSDDGWAISYTNKHAIETIKYFDFFFSETGRRLANYGIEGQHYDLLDGKPTFKQQLITSSTPITLQMRAIGAQIPRGFRQDFNYELQQPNAYALEYVKLYSNGDYYLPPFLGVTLNRSEKKVYDKYWPTILSYMLEKQQSWILGYRDIDQEWPNYLNQLELLGYSKVLKVMQTAYDRAYQ